MASQNIVGPTEGVHVYLYFRISKFQFFNQKLHFKICYMPKDLLNIQFRLSLLDLKLVYQLLRYLYHNISITHFSKLNNARTFFFLDDV